MEAGLEAGTLDPLAVLRAVPAPSIDTAPTTPTAGQILDTETNRTRVNLPPLSTNYADPLAMLERPDDAERASTATVNRLAAAAGLNQETDR